MCIKINNIFKDMFLKIFNTDEWVGKDVLFLDKRNYRIYKSSAPLMISGTPGLKFYSFIEPAMGHNFSLYTAIEKNDLKYLKKLNEKQEAAFNAKKVLINGI